MNLLNNTRSSKHAANSPVILEPNLGDSLASSSINSNRFYNPLIRVLREEILVVLS